MKRHAYALGLSLLGLVGTTLAANDLPKPGHGIRKENLDTAAAPCQDFYQYANGGWLKATEIPAEKARFGAFDELSERNRAILHEVLEEASKAKGLKPGSVEQKVGDFYASGMDEAAIDKRGLAPLKAELAVIDTLKSSKELAPVLAKLHGLGDSGGFSAGVGIDDKDATRYLAFVSQGGLGLPDRDYYLKDDARSKDIREKYVAHLQRMMELAGDKPEQAKAEAETVMKLETRLAEASWTRVENRDPQKTYNKMSVADLAKLAPGFDWAAYFRGRLQGTGVTLHELSVTQPSFFTAFGKMAKEVPAAEWRTYLRVHLVRGAAGALSKPLEEEAFNFRGKVLSGIQVQEPRWKRVSGAVNGSLGEALGQLYVKKAFSPEAKQKVLQMVANMRAALKERINGLEWMSDATKAQAVRKLDAFMVKMGYPDHWRQYTFPVRRDDYYGNLQRAAVFEIQRNIKKLGKPVDRTEWGMTPSTVNAYYNPSLNEIVFPAGILQAPFFDPEADDAVNYGAIGVVIGHEMTHGFDDQGSQYDADGNLKNWWTDADRKAYEARTGLVVKQFDAFEPLPGEHVNGKLTLGENIADLGGLKIAYAAWKKSLNGQPAPVLDGLTGEQRFFLGFATVWRQHVRPQMASMLLKVDPHSPGRFRVMGPLSNLPEFYEAFGCKDGDPMLRPGADRPAIW